MATDEIINKMNTILSKYKSVYLNSTDQVRVDNSREGDQSVTDTTDEIDAKIDALDKEIVSMLEDTVKGVAPQSKNTALLQLLEENGILPAVRSNHVLKDILMTQSIIPNLREYPYAPNANHVRMLVESKTLSTKDKVPNIID